MCDFLVTFVTATEGADERISRLTPMARRTASESGLATTKLCANGAAPVKHASRAVLTENYTLSADANELTNRVLSAVELSENAYDLATRLNSVLADAARLDAVNRAVVEAAVSVAQNSFEYWEAELPVMEDRFYNDYHGCLTQTYNAGYSEDTGRDACLNGGVAATKFLSPPSSPESRGLSLARSELSPVRVCGLGRHYRRLAGADVVGGITGAVNGAKTAGWEGAAAGAVGGAAIASLGSFLKSTWEIFWCAM